MYFASIEMLMLTNVIFSTLSLISVEVGRLEGQSRPTVTAARWCYYRACAEIDSYMFVPTTRGDTACADIGSYMFVPTTRGDTACAEMVHTCLYPPLGATLHVQRWFIHVCTHH